MAPSMLPPPMQDTACSGPLPPKTTATLIFRCTFTLPPLSGPTPGAKASDAIAFRLGAAAGQQDSRLADRQAIPDDCLHDLRNRHLHAMLAGKLQHGLR